MSLELYPLKKFVSVYPWLTLRALQGQVYRMQHNGLAKAGAFLKVGNRILVDKARYDQWLEKQRIRE